MTVQPFLGRKNYLEILTKRVKALKEGYRQNIAFVGNELIGKTSLILKFLTNFSDPKILPVYLNIRPDSLEYFAKKFIGALLYNFLSNSGIHLEEDLNFLIHKAQRYIPKTVTKIKSILAILERKKRWEIFPELFALCDLIKEETGKLTLVIFDEFHYLDALGIKNLYRDWSKILILQKNTMFILISSARFSAKKILSENLSLLFGNFEIIDVEPFDLKASEEFLTEKLGRISLDRFLKNFLINFAGGSPFYLEVIAAALCKIKSQDISDSVIQKDLLINALGDLLFEETGTLNQRFQHCLSNLFKSFPSQDYLPVLYSIAEGSNKIRNLAKKSGKQKNDLVKIINRLIELDVIIKNGDFLKINDRIFAFWLKFVHEKKNAMLNFDTQTQKDTFNNGVRELLHEFIMVSQRGFTERIEELLHLFENEGVYIERRRLRLTPFREIKPVSFNYPTIKNGILGRSTDTLWIIAIKDNLITEEDIVSFAKECKKYRQKTQRRILITPLEIDSNVRLKALEEKIWPWNLNNVNLLCELFSKPAIII